MFGHQHDVITKDQQTDAAVPLPESTINALTNAPATTSETDSPLPAAPAPPIDDQSQDDTLAAAPQTVVPPAPSVDGVTGPSGQSAPSANYSNNFIPPPPDPAPAPVSVDGGNDDTSYASEEPANTEAEVPEVDDTPTSVQPEDLLKIKQEALQSLSPLVGQLDVSPQEKFRTLMMLIQASDDHGMLTQAYEVAKSIKDEKSRAQALLDVVNEINYFTQKHSER